MNTNTIKFEVQEGIINPILIDPNQKNPQFIGQYWKVKYANVKINSDFQDNKSTASHFFLSIHNALQDAVNQNWYNIVLQHSSFGLIYVIGDVLESKEDCHSRLMNRAADLLHHINTEKILNTDYSKSQLQEICDYLKISVKQIPIKE